MGNKRKNKNKQNKTESLTEPEKTAEQGLHDVDESYQENNENTKSMEKESTKRPLEDDDNDSDSEKPKKAKKKKNKALTAGEESSNKKGKKSIRQLKKEKYAQRQAEAQTAAKDQLKSQCLNYLSQWKHDKQNWKFMKAKQVWLYKNKFSTQLVPDANWPVFLEYFESAQGNIKKMLLDDAQKIIKQMDEWTETNQKAENEENNDEESTDKPDEKIYSRARSLIQCLQE